MMKYWRVIPAKAGIYGSTGSQGPGCRIKSGMTSKNQVPEAFFRLVVIQYPVSFFDFIRHQYFKPLDTAS
jgi:hypothetical protein